MKKVIVGMSGGVDSSVTAALLKEKGYEVIGITMILTDKFDIEDSKKVCKQLEIPLYTLDLRDKFKELIKDTFLKEYKNGLTPNPCVLCNKHIKFGLMYNEMQKYKADYIATGHYAQIKDGKLYKANDKNKDQTYFLYNLTKEQLQKIIFPLANLTKQEVRKIAEKYNLPVANKKESNDICFIGQTGFKNYIKQNIGTTEGNIININTNKIIGKHQGLMYYTIGQRKGLNIGGNTNRLFVCKKDQATNTLYVAEGNQNKYLTSTEAILENVNIINEIPNKCTAKFRYRQEENEVYITKLKNKKLLVKYPQGVTSVTPGQSCVLYKNEQCLGGGIIKEIIK